MSNRIHLLIVASLICCLIPTAHAETVATELECLGAARYLAATDAPSGRRYAPDREVQVLHLALDITPEFKQRILVGKATIRFRPIITPLRELKLDAVDLKVDSIAGTEHIQSHQVTDENIIITFAEVIAPGKEASVTITYRAEPAQGIYFRTPEMGYPEGDTHVFSQGEQIEARHWYPCLDAPNFMFTSEVTCRVPSDMTAISNGRLVSETKDAATGLTAFHWTQEKPHVNYLVTLCAGYFKKIEDKYEDLPLAFYAPASRIGYASNSFAGTKDMMAFFEHEIGVPYPWVKYDQICVYDFVAGGMENTSATTLNESTLFSADSENIRTSEGLVAHELAHQWFGDLVTCKDWSHIWLNEGFATYYQTLYNGHKNGRDAMLYELYGRSRQITGMSNDVNAIVRRTYNAPSEMFGYLAYPKGSWVLHMLRSQLGEELYRRCIKIYLERHQHGNVVTDDLRAVIEEQTGRSYDQFFDQWVYHAHHPELDATYSWDETTKLAKISIRQVQRVSDNVLLFSFPLTIRFTGDFGVKDQTIQVAMKEEDFYFPLESAPRIARLDPDLTLLAKVSFPVPAAMLGPQLTNQTDVIGRLLAVDQLGNRKDKDTVAKLKRSLGEDPFYGVRIEASRALRSIHTDEALDALLASTKQPDARVRRQVVSDIGNFYRDTAHASARSVLETEKNPAILAVAVENLAGYAKPETQATLLRFLESESFRNELAVAAIDAMRLQDDPAYIAPLLASLLKREAAYTSRGFAQALGALGYLARNEEKKDDVRDFIIGHVNSKKRAVQLASINALGTLGDPKAIAVLQTFTNAARESRERTAAARAVADLRAARRPVDDFKNLRQEVLDLQKSDRDLRKELDDLKKRIETWKKAPPAPATPTTKKKKQPPVTSPRNAAN